MRSIIASPLLSLLILITACASTGVSIAPQSGTGVADIDPAASPPLPQPGVVRLHILGDDPRVEVHGPSSGTPTYHGGVATRLEEGVVCRAPCGSVVDGRSGQWLRFGGPGITSSSKFQLLDKKGDQWVHVEPGSSDLRTAGFSVLALGAGPVAAGVVMSWVLAVRSVDEDAPTSATAGLAVSFAVGGAGVIGGLTMIGMSRTTYQFVERGHATGRSGPD